MREFELEAKLAESLGQAAARAALDALIAEWGGCRLDIPNGTSSRKRRRDNEIRRMYQAGADLFALRDQFGLSDRHLRRIVARVH
ncbi:Mor transcription activator domain protein [Solidesulfovibrio fructosivorans JJ]]|uniref:Mor transcription activator domain protein n=1 Tax=Solidesulfovibrio fructosivorans JJ] TaxID=596151 RepID=E1JVF1_SOLFR|nr:Mor transcription activator family protein [Solidesulfovibrio fructosivorans]EFL51745.1 Mor transcription activator domain protein [Solidesulfovibrio fructosivorans JJ]]